MDSVPKDYPRINRATVSTNGDVFEPSSSNNAKQRVTLVEWLNCVLPDLNLPINAADEELRAFLVDGSVLCRVLNKLKPGSISEFGAPVSSSQSRSENVERFLSAMDKLGLPRFQAADLEKGSMKIVLDCLLTLQTHFLPNLGRYNASSQRDEPFRMLTSPTSTSDSKFQRVLRSPIRAEPSAALINHVGHKFHEVFQLKQGSYTDIPAAKISEMMKSNSLDNAPTQSLLCVVNGILDESIERKNGEIPHRVACLLRKVAQEIERRISTQAEHLRTQNNLFKAREEKYQSRIRVLEVLAAGTSEEIQCEKNSIEVKKKIEEQYVERLMKEKESYNQEIANLKEELEIARRKHEKDYSQGATDLKQELEVVTRKYEEQSRDLKQELEVARRKYEEQSRDLKQELEVVKGKHEDQSRDLKQELEVAKRKHEDQCTNLKQELEVAKRKYEEQSLLWKSEATGSQQELENRLKEAVSQLTESRNKVKELENKLKEAVSHLTESMNKVKELEAFSESKSQSWNKKERVYYTFTEAQLGALRELRFASESIRQEIAGTQKSYSEDFSILGTRIKAMDEAAKNYHSLLAENRKMHNELQELKGNIRVYCRVRPFLPGQKQKQSTVEYIGENGEIVVSNPSKQGKEARRSFKFNKVYSPTATQAEVFADTQPLIQSVLDGYNVCILAYGQTGSGKTYTMTGPDGATEAEWGVNYRALNDLFRISQSRKNSYTYEISVQMVEIYNEQVRDLLSNDGTQKRLGILATTQPNGLAVPDASIHPVSKTSDVLDLMSSGLKNRARGATALNERSSRSHSVVSIHARGTDLKGNSTIRSSLHLVDLAGSERVDRSEVTGDRLKEAQHINKSLSALGDVIFALAQKSAHVPYRNSKLTQVLQSSLGGQAKTLMFVQLNPDIGSATESISTLKFAERVSGVELGAAKSSKDVRDVRDLMEQASILVSMYHL
ncbi:kinesin-like protein KIN-14C isoform X2 [Henckelia pumila]|uniref:kinesin-like protein KIN-14C isoform X2 n=1 Tax=Henckelia pumila TaxID=405737 RepID=UPI003C6E3BFE